MSSVNHRSTSTRFCFPKEVYKHKHNIRFLRPNGFTSGTDKKTSIESSPSVGLADAKKCQTTTECEVISTNKCDNMNKDLGKRSDIEERAIALLQDLQKAKKARLAAAKNDVIASKQGTICKPACSSMESTSSSRNSTFKEHSVSFRNARDTWNSSFREVSGRKSSEEPHIVKSPHLISNALTYAEKNTSYTKQSGDVLNPRAIPWQLCPKWSCGPQTELEGGSPTQRTTQTLGRGNTPELQEKSDEYATRLHGTHKVRQDCYCCTESNNPSSICFRSAESYPTQQRFMANNDAKEWSLKDKNNITDARKQELARSTKLFKTILPKTSTNLRCNDIPRYILASNRISTSHEGLDDYKMKSPKNPISSNVNESIRFLLFDYNKGSAVCNKQSGTEKTHEKYCSSSYRESQFRPDCEVCVNKQKITNDSEKKRTVLPYTSKNGDGERHLFRITSNPATSEHIHTKPPMLLQNKSGTCIKFVKNGSNYNETATISYKDGNKNDNHRIINPKNNQSYSSRLRVISQNQGPMLRRNGKEHYPTDGAAGFISTGLNVNRTTDNNERSSQKRIYSPVIQYAADARRTGDIYYTDGQESPSYAGNNRHIVVTYGYNRPQKQLKKEPSQFCRENVFIQVYNPGYPVEEERPDSDMQHIDVNKIRHKDEVKVLSSEERSWMPNEDQQAPQLVQVTKQSLQNQNTTSNISITSSSPSSTISLQAKVNQSFEAFSVSSHDTEIENDETDSAFSQSDFGGDDDNDDVAPIRGHKTLDMSCDLAEKRHKGPRLYRFLLELLEQPKKYDCIVWIDKNTRVFKFLDSKKVALLWGIRKNKTNMKFENFARSLRCYKTRGILKKPRQKLVYQFAEGW